MSHDDDGDPFACWLDSNPCSCGAQNWVAHKTERVAVQMGQTAGGDLLIPVKGGQPIRRRSINLHRPMQGIFAVNLREEEVDKGPGANTDPEHEEGPHEAVQVLFACQKCGAQFHCTYEMVSAEKGKKQSFGRYARYCKTLNGAPEDRCCQDEHHYDQIQRVYLGMWDRDKFSRHYANCMHWSNEFWWKLHPEQYKQKKISEEKSANKI